MENLTGDELYAYLDGKHLALSVKTSMPESWYRTLGLEFGYAETMTVFLQGVRDGNRIGFQNGNELRFTKDMTPDYQKDSRKAQTIFKEMFGAS